MKKKKNVDNKKKHTLNKSKYSFICHVLIFIYCLFVRKCFIIFILFFCKCSCPVVLLSQYQGGSMIFCFLFNSSIFNKLELDSLNFRYSQLRLTFLCNK